MLPTRVPAFPTGPSTGSPLGPRAENGRKGKARPRAGRESQTAGEAPPAPSGPWSERKPPSPSELLCPAERSAQATAERSGAGRLSPPLTYLPPRKRVFPRAPAPGSRARAPAGRAAAAAAAAAEQPSGAPSSRGAGWEKSAAATLSAEAPPAHFLRLFLRKPAGQRRKGPKEHRSPRGLAVSLAPASRAPPGLSGGWRDRRGAQGPLHKAAERRGGRDDFFVSCILAEPQSRLSCSFLSGQGKGREGHQELGLRRVPACPHHLSPQKEGVLYPRLRFA